MSVHLSMTHCISILTSLSYMHLINMQYHSNNTILYAQCFNGDMGVRMMIYRILFDDA